MHGVTHRSVEREAGLPAGTASNYFRSREALLVAVAERIGEPHYADMDAAGATYEPPAGADTRARATGLIAGSLLAAATVHRERYLAIFERRLESLRRRALTEALSALMRNSIAFTTGHHAALGPEIPPEAAPTLKLIDVLRRGVEERRWRACGRPATGAPAALPREEEPAEEEGASGAGEPREERPRPLPSPRQPYRRPAQRAGRACPAAPIRKRWESGGIPPPPAEQPGAEVERRGGHAARVGAGRRAGRAGSTAPTAADSRPGQCAPIVDSSHVPTRRFES